MAAITCEEQALANIVRCELETYDEQPKVYRFTTASEGSYSAVVNEGQETILRVKNELLATNRFEDIQYGSDINLTQVTFVPEILAIVDGGTVTRESGETGKITKYQGPIAGAPVNRKLFKLKLYVEQKDVSGETQQYVCFTFESCKGKPAAFTFKDGEFITPQYTIVSRIPTGSSPYTMEYMKTLPQ